MDSPSDTDSPGRPRCQFFYGEVHRRIFTFGEAYKGIQEAVSQLPKKEGFRPPQW